MRKIIFRWKTKSGNLVYWSLISLHTDIENPIIRALDYDYKVDPETVGQFTWMHDKNGVEIYENDIVYKEWYGKKWLIVWDEPWGRWQVNYWPGTGWWDISEHIFWKTLEIIGNIHQNPELLPANP
jgi:uncharacterized phage protein (TIGR01671 family)